MRDTANTHQLLKESFGAGLCGYVLKGHGTSLLPKVYVSGIK
jgi:hypothetical protein